MRYLSIYRAVESYEPPTPELMAAMGQLIGEMTKDGTLIATEGCLPSVKGFRVRRAGDKMTVTDGPFTEAKELVAGFALIEAKSKAEAVELSKRFLAVVGDGECEVRQVGGPDDCGPDFTTELLEQETAESR